MSFIHNYAAFTIKISSIDEGIFRFVVPVGKNLSTWIMPIMKIKMICQNSVQFYGKNIKELNHA